MKNEFGPPPVNSDYDRMCSPGNCLRDTVDEHVARAQREPYYGYQGTPELVEEFKSTPLDPANTQMCEPFERTTEATVTPKGCVFERICRTSLNQVDQGEPPFPPIPPKPWPPREMPIRTVDVDHPGVTDKSLRQAQINNPHWRFR